jgi:hypothetical protein
VSGFRARRISARGRTRKLGLATIAAALTVAVVHVVPALADPPSSDVHRDVEHYVLFATDKLTFKGAENVANGYVHGGDIGVNATDGEMDVCANYRMHLDDGTQANAATLHGSNLCDFYDVYANTVTGNPPIVPRHGQGTLTANNSLPLIANLPPFPAFQCDATNPVHVTSGSLDLAPGLYGDFMANNNTTVTLHDGTYTFCDFQMGKHTTVNQSDGTVLQIEKEFDSQDDGYFGPSCLAQIYAAGDGTMGMSNNSEIHGRIWAPNGHINLGTATNLFGKFWAHEVTSDSDVNVDATGCSPNNSTTTTSSSSTSSSTSTSTSVPESTTTSSIPESTATTSSSTTSTTTSTTSTTSTSTSSSTSTSVPESTTTSSIPESTTVVTEGTTATTASTTSTIPENTSVVSESTSTVPSSVTTAGSVETTTTVSHGSLPFTGSSGLPPALGVGSLVLGGALLLVNRRRRRTL